MGLSFPLSILFLLLWSSDRLPPFLKEYPFLSISKQPPNHTHKLIRHPRRSTQITHRLLRLHTPIRPLDGNLQIPTIDSARLNGDIRRRGGPKRRVLRQIREKEI